MSITGHPFSVGVALSQQKAEGLIRLRHYRVMEIKGHSTSFFSHGI